MLYVRSGHPGSVVAVAPRYENFIGGKWQPPGAGRYRADLSSYVGIGRNERVVCATPEPGA